MASTAPQTATRPRFRADPMTRDRVDQLAAALDGVALLASELQHTSINPEALGAIFGVFADQARAIGVDLAYLN